MIKTAVVILNWNGRKFLELFLEKVVELTDSNNCRIYIADNASNDGSVQYIRSYHPDVELIIMTENLGFAGGYNHALSVIEAQYYVLLNSDIEVSEGWLKPLTDLLDSDSTISACQPKIRSYSQKDRFEHAGAAGGYIDKYGYPFCRGRIFDHTEKDEGQYDDQKDIFWSSGACMIIRSSVWKECGGFDNSFFAHMEEIDLCWRMNSRGYRIVYCPDSFVYHVGGGTLAYDSPDKLYLNFRNNLFMIYKNHPEKNFSRILFLRMLMDGIAGIRFVLQLKFRSMLIILKAHRDFYRSIKSLRIQRNMNMEQSGTIREGLILKKSVMFSFFLRGKKTYTSLY